MEAGRRCLNLAKGRQRYVFRYAPGQESQVLAALLECAERPDLDFDYYDAAVLGYQMGKWIEHIADTRVAVSPN